VDLWALAKLVFHLLTKFLFEDFKTSSIYFSIIIIFSM
jgi:hypothetical protein